MEKLKEKFGPHFTLTKCQFYATFTFAVLGLGSFSVLLFLVPFAVDPTLATIMSDFSEMPVDCQVVQSKYILGWIICEDNRKDSKVFSTLGASNCSWTSCREGCTTDIFECHQILVEYTPLPKDGYLLKAAKNKNVKGQEDRLRAALFPNIKGCGYPPAVDCSKWIKENGQNDSRISCHYSRSNTSTAITILDIKSDWRELILSTFVPIILLIISGAGLFILRTDLLGWVSKEAKR